jgi:hypothetical protein
MLATRRRAAAYIKDSFLVDDSLREVDRLHRDVWDVLNFFEDLGYFVKIGAVGPHTMWRTFGPPCFDAVYTPFHLQYIANRGACVKPQVVKHNAGRSQNLRKWE